MGKKKLSKEEVMREIRRCARRLGRAPKARELIAMAGRRITRYDIHHNFGGYLKALRACDLELSGSGCVVELRDLFLEWASMARKLGRVPTITHYDRNSRYSVRPLVDRFGNWKSVAKGLGAYAEENGLAAEWQDVMTTIAEHQHQQEELTAARGIPGSVPPARLNKPRVWEDRPLLGPPLTEKAMAHSPTNESGVVYAFGSMARELGFVVSHIQTSFPDCEAVREVEKGRWQKVRVEFEFESRNFLRHLHRAEDCDVIVCWIHNWEECPLDVVELRSVGVSN
jgi:hypothetical protein